MVTRVKDEDLEATSIELSGEGMQTVLDSLCSQEPINDKLMEAALRFGAQGFHYEKGDENEKVL